MTDDQRREANRAAAQGLVDELMAEEAYMQKAVDVQRGYLDEMLAKRANARRAAKSEWTKWRGYGLAPLVWAEDAAGVEPPDAEDLEDAGGGFDPLNSAQGPRSVAVEGRMDAGGGPQ